VPGVRGQALAVLRLMGELKERHPSLEIESCAGGGGRIDLATLEVADRVWVSDTIDAHERHRLVPGTGMLLPPELLGTHVGSGADHTTGRSLSLDFRAGTAVWGHLGIEWDLSTESPEDVARLAAWVAFHKSVRELLHSGVVVHADLSNPALHLEGVVAQDGREALYRFSVLDHSLSHPLGRLVLPGLSDDLSYRVGLPAPQQLGAVRDAGPRWMREPVVLPGRVLGTVGIEAPAPRVHELVIIGLTAV
jgi:alpha-galactosidase